MQLYTSTVPGFPHSIPFIYCNSHRIINRTDKGEVSPCPEMAVHIVPYPVDCNLSDRAVKPRLLQELLKAVLVQYYHGNLYPISSIQFLDPGIFKAFQTACLPEFF